MSAWSQPQPERQLGVPCPDCFCGSRGQSRPRGDVTHGGDQPGLPLRLVAGLWRRLWRMESWCRSPRVPRRWAASCATSSFCICRTTLSACCRFRHSWGNMGTPQPPDEFPCHPATTQEDPSKQAASLGLFWMSCPGQTPFPSWLGSDLGSVSAPASAPTSRSCSGTWMVWKSCKP